MLTVGAIDGPNLVEGTARLRRGGRRAPRRALRAGREGPRGGGRAAAARRRGAEHIRGFVDDAELARRYAAAAVYVQASTHEGFGMTVAEAMLAGCVPVVTPVGALPEVVGDTGVVVADPTAEAVADGVRKALALGPDARRQARARVLEQFTLERREHGLLATVRAASSRS